MKNMRKEFNKDSKFKMNHSKKFLKISINEILNIQNDHRTFSPTTGILNKKQKVQKRIYSSHNQQQYINPNNTVAPTSSHSKIHNEKQTLNSNKNKTNKNNNFMKVYIRFRPKNDIENKINNSVINSSSCVKYYSQKYYFTDCLFDCVQIEDNKNNISSPLFTFDTIFNENTKQELLYNQIGKNILNDILSGYNISVFSYGYTGTGKTYTLYGDIFSSEKMGIIPRLIKDLFIEIEKDNDDTIYNFEISCFEINNDTITDLYTKEIKNNMSVNKISLYSYEEFLDYFDLCNDNFMINNCGNMIFVLEVTQNSETKKYIKKSIANFIDLSGDENMSSLENIIENKKCDDNILNKYLKNVLFNNCKSKLIVNNSPCSYDYKKILNNLNFAEKAKKIEYNANINIKLSYEELEKMMTTINNKNKSYNIQEAKDIKISYLNDELNKKNEIISNLEKIIWKYENTNYNENTAKIEKDAIDENNNINLSNGIKKLYEEIKEIINKNNQILKRNIINVKKNDLINQIKADKFKYLEKFFKQNNLYMNTMNSFIKIINDLLSKNVELFNELSNIKNNNNNIFYNNNSTVSICNNYTTEDISINTLNKINRFNAKVYSYLNKNNNKLAKNSRKGKNNLIKNYLNNNERKTVSELYNTIIQNKPTNKELNCSINTFDYGNNSKINKNFNNNLNLNFMEQYKNIIHNKTSFEIKNEIKKIKNFLIGIYQNNIKLYHDTIFMRKTLIYGFDNNIKDDKILNLTQKTFLKSISARKINPLSKKNSKKVVLTSNSASQGLCLAEKKNKKSEFNPKESLNVLTKELVYKNIKQSKEKNKTIYDKNMHFSANKKKSVLYNIRINKNQEILNTHYQPKKKKLDYFTDVNKIPYLYKNISTSRLNNKLNLNDENLITKNEKDIVVPYKNVNIFIQKQNSGINIRNLNVFEKKVEKLTGDKDYFDINLNEFDEYDITQKKNYLKGSVEVLIKNYLNTGTATRKINGLSFSFDEDKKLRMNIVGRLNSNKSPIPMAEKKMDKLMGDNFSGMNLSD